MVSSSRVVTVGAYDRFNYGDLLFPLALDFAANAESFPPLTHAGLLRREMSGTGGVPTERVSSLVGRVAPPEVSGMIMGGGEVLSATWSQALINFAPQPVDFGLRAAKKLLGHRVADSVSRALLRGSWPTPYVPPRSVAARIPVVANAVGASSVLNLRGRARAEVLASLDASKYVSVRDQVGLVALEKQGIHCCLAPDSVSILKLMTPEADTDSNGSLVFQCSQDWYRENSGVVDALATAGREFEEIILLPIGLAGGHGDHLALESIASLLKARGVSGVKVHGQAEVWSIAAVIAKASVFVGSSLHGAITSMAYGKPHVALRGVSKLTAYIDTWGSGLTPSGVDSAGLGDAIRSARSISATRLDDRGRELESLSLENSSRIFDALS